MYASFFGLRELPFNNTPDPRFFYSTPDHEEALASLIYAISESRGFVLLTGEVGAGKTLVTRLMLRHFNDRIVFAGINHTSLSSTDLLRCICDEFRVEADPNDTGADLIRRLQDFLVARFAENKPVVLMLDEAQALTRDAFEQVRMIGNVETDDAKLLQIVIVGQPELRERFEADDMRQLRQRIFRSFHLRGLTREQTEGYIRHRLSVGGAQYPERVFDQHAINAIHEYSQGLPRLINTVCDNAMLSAYAADQLSIDGPFVQRVIEQMTAVNQGGPHFASPHVAVEDGRLHAAPDAASGLESVDTGDLHEMQLAVRKLSNRLAIEGRRVSEAVLTELSEAVERMRREIYSAINDARAAQSKQTLESTLERACVVETRLKAEMLDTTDALHAMVARAAGLHERLRAIVTETESRIDQVACRATRIQSSVDGLIEHIAEASRRCEPQIARLRRQTEAARKAAEELRAAKLEGCLPRAIAGPGAQPQPRSDAPRPASPTAEPVTLLERTRALTEVLDENRAAISAMRSTLAAAGSPLARATGSSRLAEQVKALSTLIGGARPNVNRPA